MNPCLVRSLAAVGVAIVVAAPAPARDWGDVQLAWRGDPRATADAPFESDMSAGRRPSRRAQRRAATRRRMPLDELPVEVRQPADPVVPLNVSEVFSAPRPPASAPMASTLGSPFAGEAPGPGVIVHRDQPSLPAATDRQRFDIFLPAGCSTGGMPLVVWIHGDGWRDGSRADCPIAWLTDEGYAVASVGYRLTDTATFPAQLDDCRDALDEIRRGGDLWGIDPERIALVGSGAGGHLAALVGLSAQTEPRVAGICAVAAPSDLASLGPDHERPSSPASLLIGGPLAEFREAAQRASPISYVSADDPPCLLIHGDRDESIPTAQSIALDRRLREAGVESMLVVLPGTGHRAAIDRSAPAGRALLEFLDRTLSPGVRGPAVEAP